MSISDLWVRDVITNYGIYLFIFILAAIYTWQKWPHIRRAVYKSYLTGFEVECAELLSTYKDHLFEFLEHIISSDESLRSRNCIRLLEIGVKTGENIQFYPYNTHLIAVDRNLELADYLENGNHSRQFSHVTIESIIVGDGSYLDDVPTGYVDVVVTTRSLCSVASLQSTLHEIHRVLAPGGYYLFIEHIPESEGTFIRWLQKVLSQTGIWPSLFGGCHLDINPLVHIKKVGFDRIIWNTFTLEGYVSQRFQLILSRQHVFGVAIR
ncbi:thiol S-methyltransferase TMT1A-like isoform X2 [Ptiloglossa arizonensis]|uniref:thiol S-methyltransferase TMT1A-like isoform X2 n=1 Tax=Ptiloglossa arizonensis TaxID=3350558 RepID=UPI003FA17FF1